MAAVMVSVLFPAGAGEAGAPPRASPLAGTFAPVALEGRVGISMSGDSLAPLPSDTDPGWSWNRLSGDGLDRGLSHREGVAWVRLDFSLRPGTSFAEPAILYSHPADAEEVYLNGALVGGAGMIAPRFTVFPNSPRLVSFPPDLLRAGENRLTMRVLLAGKSVRVLNAPLLLGERGDLEARRQALLQPILALEGAFLALVFFLPVFYGFLLLQGVMRGEYVFLALFTFLYGMTFFLGSHLFLLAGVPSSLSTQAQTVLSGLLVLVMITLVTSVTGGRFGTVYGILLGGGALFVLLDLLLPPLTALTSLSLARKVFLSLVGLYYLLLAGKSVFSRRPESIPVFAGVGAYVAGSRIELFWGLNLQDIAMGAFSLSMLFALATRHARLKDRLMDLSGRLLDSHEEERRRIARDLHDTVGQGILALRLRLQLLASRAREGGPPPAEALEEASEETLGILADVRRAALDLRPSHIESRGILEALHWYGAVFAERHRMEVVFHDPAEALPEPAVRVKDNLYRIFQEALQNAVRHAEGGRIDVSCFRSRGRLVLQVADDGKGFAPGSVTGKGMGLSTMAERAELLGGTCLVESAKGTGTVVTVEVPVT